MKKKLLLMVFATMLILSFSGCGGSEAANDTAENDSEVQSEARDELKEIPVGKVVSVQTDNGEVKVSVDEIEWSGWSEYADYEEGTDAVLVDCSVENVSYSGDYDGQLDICSIITVKDKDGYSLETEYSTWEGGTYEPVCGGMYESKQGEKKRVAIPYLIKKEPTELDVIIGDKYIVTLKIE